MIVLERAAPFVPSLYQGRQLPPLHNRCDEVVIQGTQFVLRRQHCALTIAICLGLNLVLLSARRSTMDSLASAAAAPSGVDEISKNHSKDLAN